MNLNIVVMYFINYQVFAVYYNVKENATTTSTLPTNILDTSKKRSRYV